MQIASRQNAGDIQYEFSGWRRGWDAVERLRPAAHMTDLASGTVSSFVSGKALAAGEVIKLVANALLLTNCGTERGPSAQLSRSVTRAACVTYLAETARRR